MKPLPTSHEVVTWLCMCPADDSTTKMKRLYYIAFTLLVCIVIFAGLLASATFILKYWSIDFEGCLYDVFQGTIFAAMLNLIIVGLIHRDRIAIIFAELSKLYAANETAPSFRYMADANSKSEWLWKICLKFGLVAYLINVSISTITSVIYCFCKYGVFDTEHLYKPLKNVVPWDQYTLYGYLGDIIFGVFAGETYFICNGAVLILFTSICWHHEAFYKQIRYTTLQFDQPEDKANNGILCELLYFHITVRDWFLESSKVYSPFVLIQLICHVIYIAAVVFELDLRMRHFYFDIFILLCAFVCGLLNLYAYCYFGQLTTNCYEKMAECLYEFNWYEKSLDLQKKILLMIQNMQQPVFYHGFGLAVLNLETFVKVIRAICSYYMLFKTFTSE